MRIATTLRMRAATRALCLAGVLLASACLQSTAPQPSLLQLSGAWKYTGVQTVPVRATLTGTLKVSLESGTSFQGRLDLISANQQTGQSSVLGGLVSGSESGTNVIDFDAEMDVVRRHVGQIVADTITGTWIGSAPDGTMSSGTFRVEREP
jgi:predicted TIM-barrel enzyme